MNLVSDISADELASVLEAIGSGEAGALHSLYKGTASQLYSVCLHIVRTPESAEDVLHDVYIKVWKSAASFERSRGTAWAWLCVLTRNAALDRLRARGRRHNFDREGFESHNATPDDRSAEDRLADRQASSAAIDEFASFGAETEDCLRAAFVEGLTYSEIAERDDIPLGTVKSRIRRALMTMKANRCD